MNPVYLKPPTISPGRPVPSLPRAGLQGPELGERVGPPPQPRGHAPPRADTIRVLIHVSKGRAETAAGELRPTLP